MPDLKPCPFCGKEANTFQVPENTSEEQERHPLWKWNHPGFWVVGCNNCLCFGSIHNAAMTFLTEEQAAEYWNRRADDD